MRDFPRGGKELIVLPSSNLLSGKNGKHKKEGKLHRKNKNKSDISSEIDANFTPNTADCLTYTTLLEGMIVLARVHAVTEYNIAVSLPGRIGGQIPITNISESYNNLLQSLVESKGSQQDEFKSLSDLCKRGDYLVCYVKNTDASGKYRITLSIEPQLINQSLNLSLLRKGAKIICSVASVEDHGYVVDTGIKTLRGFLSNNDVQNNLKYYPGQQISCYIKTLKSDENMTTIKLTTKSKSDQLVISDDQPLDGLIPGIRLNLNISKILSNGLQVTFNESNIGYINQLYLKKPLSTYEKGSEISATLMYVLPTVKYAYFCQCSLNNEKTSIEVGEMIENAQVLFKESRGVVFSLKKGIRGFLPFKRANVDHEKINETFTPDSVHKCRIISYEMFDRVYICSMQQSVVKGNTLIPEAIHPGDKTTVEIIKINDNGFLVVKSGSILGNVAPEHVHDVDEEDAKPLKIGDKVEARVLGHHTQGNGIMFTLKKSLVNSKKKILSDINDAKIGRKYQAVVISVRDEGLLVKFYENLKGWIPAKLLDKKIGGTKNYVVGQVVMVTIKEIDKENGKLILFMYDKTKMNKKKEDALEELKIGSLVEGSVVESSINGIYIRIKIKNDSDTVTGFLPAGHMAPCTEIGTYLSAKYVPGDKLSALVFSVTPELLLSRTFTLQKESPVFNNLKVNECIPCSIKEISTNGLKVILSVEDFNDYGVIPYHKVDNTEALSTNQLLFGKITGINKKEKKLFLTTSLHEIWTEVVKNDSDMIAAVDLLTLYFSKLKELCNHDCYKNKKIASMHLGQRVSGIVDQVTDHGLIVKLENDVMATVRQNHFYGTFEKGDEVKGSVLWVNYIHEIVEITLIPALVNRITVKQKKLSETSTDVQLRGEILLVTNWFILVLLKGQAKGTLAALPARRHINDLEPNLRPYTVGKEIRCYAVLGKNETDLLPICLVKSAFETRKSALLQKNSLKREIKKDSEDNVTGKKVKRLKVSNINSNNSVEIEDEPNDKDDKTIKVEITKEKKENNDEKKSKDVEDLMIPECKFFWDSKPDPELLKQLSSDSEDDDEEDTEPKQKKRKLNAAERRELERQKEREIREREEALASNKAPSSADQFDRLVLAEPNNSMIWMQYMAYHLQATEIEKARMVVRRALKTINFREENEKLNMWKAWLNLESRFGSSESLNDVFHQAINANDSKKIHLHMLTIHLDAERKTELEKTVKAIIGKFKDDVEVWIECGTAFVKIGLKEKSRLLMQQALQSLPISKHVYLMVKFAQAENNYGDKERAKTLFENILTSYPKRVDVWSTYVDFLVKDKEYEIARKVLEKAVAQTLPPKKMKTLFKKYVAFEEQHGTPDGVDYAKKLAVSYIENISKNPVNE
ncbi:protein RRP5 homolog [Chelonus insularis]|uniref:protein RRP5 homolog n=1 Tax=Chelonus insularis TaxID=460826 RepID=UPI00158EF6B2|nr:protein RRP5 homolog [Chelonus insularis]XP_034951425.1 protein RRP5 homolog [Chelonus insularis]